MSRSERISENMKRMWAEMPKAEKKARRKKMVAAQKKTLAAKKARLKHSFNVMGQGSKKK